MEHIYARMRQRAREIVSRLPLPDFYRDHSSAQKLSRQYLETHPVTVELRTFVAGRLNEKFGHGLEHATKVAVDAGALMIVENESDGHTGNFITRQVIIVQCAGLLHDAKRENENHAQRGAAYAESVLDVYPLDFEEIEDISRAIRNHEAFKHTVEAKTPEGGLISNCLYDADKFRWGPDNFTDTIWSMVTFSKVPVPEFMDRYQHGIKKIASIKDTFRTATGKKYGPQIIDLGLAAGEELFQIINTEFAHLL
jgi:hypothetical protein